MDALLKLRQALSNDENARRKFMEDLKNLIRSQGLDPDDRQTLQQLGIKDLDINKPSFLGDAAASTVIITITS